MKFVIEKVLEIRAPVEVVWEVLTDLPRYGEWNPFLPACQTTFKPGDPIDLSVKLMARPQQQREWMREFVPRERFAYSMKPMPLGALSSYRSHELQALEAASTHYRSYFELQGWLMPLVRGLLGAKLETGFAGMSEGVKRRAEELWTQRAGKA